MVFWCKFGSLGRRFGKASCAGDAAEASGKGLFSAAARDKPTAAITGTKRPRLVLADAEGIIARASALVLPAEPPAAGVPVARGPPPVAHRGSGPRGRGRGGQGRGGGKH